MTTAVIIVFEMSVRDGMLAVGILYPLASLRKASDILAAHKPPGGRTLLRERENQLSISPHAIPCPPRSGLAPANC